MANYESVRDNTEGFLFQGIGSYNPNSGTTVTTKTLDDNLSKYKKIAFYASYNDVIRSDSGIIMPYSDFKTRKVEMRFLNQNAGTIEYISDTQVKITFDPSGRQYTPIYIFAFN